LQVDAHRRGGPIVEYSYCTVEAGTCRSFYCRLSSQYLPAR
jgi:hypothetical protein